LEVVLHLGKTWGCGEYQVYQYSHQQRAIPLAARVLADSSMLAPVVLLDEADVFLEQRLLANLERNALVSGKC